MATKKQVSITETKDNSHIKREIKILTMLDKMDKIVAANQ
jgi:hypothetical protein